MITIRNAVILNSVSKDKDDEIIKATRLVSMLDVGRSDNFHEWFRVGLALHSIDNSLLETWIDFSKKSKKFKNYEDCEEKWKTINSNGNILTIRSLAYWAKIDNPKLYNEYIKEELKFMIYKSLEGEGESFYLAKSFHAKFSDRFVCSSIKNNKWWEFNNHRWYKIECGYSLLLLFSEDFANEYELEIGNITQELIKNDDGFKKEELNRKRMVLLKIISKLKKTSSKKDILTECKNIFYDSKFEEKLDSNIYLIGFKNGVYDLQQGIFREGRSDDYITKVFDHDYIT